MTRKTFLFSLGLLLLAGNRVQAQSPFIAKVYDFRPAPGQFVNELPEYEEGDTHADMVQKAEACIKGEEKILVSLGGYGGYIIFGFDHMVENIPGHYDFNIWGNAFYANANPNPDASPEGGSCEPGIVMVSYDANGNGEPDDAWYELAGSEYFKSETVKHYRQTYYRSDPDKVPTPDKEYAYLNDTTYIRWTNNQGATGYVYRNVFHSQSYYPLWEEADSLVFAGTKLADNYIDESGNGSYYVQYAYRWGYADNHPNTDARSGFDIAWAVDDEGNPVDLPGIHFVKVFTGVNQYCGWLGETSTEIMGAEDLHLSGKEVEVASYTEGISLLYTDLAMTVGGENIQLSSRVYSSNPALEKVIWTSGDTQIVSVDTLGVLTAVGAGSTSVYATTGNGAYTDSCRITVTDDLSAIDPLASGRNILIGYADGALLFQQLEGARIEICTLQGTCIDVFTISRSQERRAVSLRPHTVYLIRTIRGQETATRKLMIP